MPWLRRNWADKESRQNTNDAAASSARSSAPSSGSVMAFDHGRHLAQRPVVRHQRIHRHPEDAERLVGVSTPGGQLTPRHQQRPGSVHQHVGVVEQRQQLRPRSVIRSQRLLDHRDPRQMVGEHLPLPRSQRLRPQGELSLAEEPLQRPQRPRTVGHITDVHRLPRRHQQNPRHPAPEGGTSTPAIETTSSLRGIRPLRRRLATYPDRD